MRECYFIHDGGSAFVQNDPPHGKPAARNRLCLQVGNSIGQEAGPLLRRKVLVVQVASLSLALPLATLLPHLTALHSSHLPWLLYAPTVRRRRVHPVFSAFASVRPARPHAMHVRPWWP